jgi:hypothetical protein
MSLLSRPAYRTRQFFSAFRARINPSERDEAASVLGPDLLTLFASMSPRDQRHCFDVYKVLRGYGCQDKNILVAALLHDAGKGRMAGARVRLWHRVAYVLLAARAPKLLDRIANGGGPSGLASLHRHSERGAILADALGAPTPVVDLIRRHEHPDSADEHLRLLRMADDAC